MSKNKEIYELYIKNFCKFKMIYKIIANNDKIRIFGKIFVNNNKEKCLILYNDKIFPLKECFVNEDIKSGNKLEIILIVFEFIYDISYMIYDCDSLEKFLIGEDKTIDMLENLREKDEGFVFNLSSSSEKESRDFFEKNEFYNTELFSEIKHITPSDIFYTSQTPDNLIIKDLQYMFDGCLSLKYLSDISNWKTNNVLNMNHLFCNCVSLISLPEISNWNIKNVNNMSSIFYACKMEYL